MADAAMFSFAFMSKCVLHTAVLYMGLLTLGRRICYF